MKTMTELHPELLAIHRAVLNLCPWEQLKSQLERLTPAQFQMEDEHHLNILHHAIMANHMQAAHYLLLRGKYSEPHQPSCIPYLHLGSYYGCTIIVRCLLEQRPADLTCKKGSSSRCSALRKLSHSKNNKEKAKPEEVREERTDLVLESLKDFCPVDLAATKGHLRSVHHLLNAIGGPVGHHFSILEKAVLHDSPDAIRLILEEDETLEEADISDAFKSALMWKLPQPLAVLLEHGVRMTWVLNAMNPYHVMYMYSSGYQANLTRNAGLAECTEVLVKAAQDVNVYYPCGSYPLYSLLHSMMQEKEFNPYEVPVHHIRALEILLDAGADPNLDEESLTGSKYDKDPDYFFSMSLGRDPYTSALSALFTMMEQCDRWSSIDVDYLASCTQTILQHGGQANTIDRYGDTPMHNLMKCLAMIHCNCYFEVDLSTFIKALLKYGADANKPSTNGMLPANSYFTFLFEVSKVATVGELLFTSWCEHNCARQVLCLLKYMDHDQAFVAHNIVSNQFCGLADEGISRDVISYVTAQMEPYINQTRTLVFMCSSVIWKSIDRKVSSMDDLPIPNKLRNIVMAMFDSDCL